MIELSWKIRTLAKITDVTAEAWDALVPPDDPFATHAFLRALEESESVGAKAGWLPAHVAVWRGTELVGAAPAYIKMNSYGEYIFDWAWANGAERAGLRYYPKVVSAIPFTPATGRRLLVRPDWPESEVLPHLFAGLRRVCEACRGSSIHVLFCTEAEQLQMAEFGGFLPRLTYQYHWQNQNWTSFDAFLSGFRAPARKQVKKERRQANSGEFTLKTLRGPELEPTHWEALRRFYLSTIRDKGAIPYLTAAFFEQLPQQLAPLVHVEVAEMAGVPVAGSLSFQRGKHLYGRYWGSLVEAEALHFELCYYRPIENCIRERWTRFEAGAQGEHKIKRGLMPSPTFSAHQFAHPELARAVARFIAQEAQAHTDEMAWLAAQGPFKRDGATADSTSNLCIESSEEKS